MAQPLIVEVALGEATRNAAVRLEWNNDGTIAKVMTAGRPIPRAYGQGDGNHTTAWAVFGDIVRRRLVGRTRLAAAAAMTALIDAAHTPGQRDLLAIGERRSRFNTAAAQCRASIAAALAPIGDNQRAALENAIAAYLSCRNYAPLASGWLGAGQAIGAGEASALRDLRAYETSGADRTRADLRVRIWALLEGRVLDFVAGNGAIAQVPGVAAGGAGRATAVTTMVIRHLTDISTAYPVAYADAGINDGHVGAFLGGVNGAADWPDDWDDIPDRDEDAVHAPDGWSAGSATGALVILTPTTANGQTTITGLTVHSRGRTLLGSSQGHHLTAHVVFECQLRTAILGRTVGDARTALLTMAGHLNTLPTMPAVQDGSRSLPVAADPNAIFARAWAAFDRTRATLEAAQDPGAIFDALGQLAGEYLCVRNALPLTAIRLGSLANYSGEAGPRARLDAIEATATAAQSNAIYADLWNLMYLDGATHTADALSADGILDMCPGAPATPMDRLATVMMTHRMSVQAAWPRCYAASQFGTRLSLDAALNAVGFAPGWNPDTFAAQAGFDVPGPARLPFTPPGLVREGGDEEKVTIKKDELEAILSAGQRRSSRKRKDVDYQEGQEQEDDDEES